VEDLTPTLHSAAKLSWRLLKRANVILGSLSFPVRRTLTMDSLEIVADASGDSGVGVSSVSSYSEPVIMQNDSGNQSMSSLGHAPLSPPRSAKNSVPSSPASGSVNRRPLEATPANQQPPLPTLGTPSLEYGNDGVLFGLQQLELQQASMEQRRNYAPDPRLNQGYLPMQERNGGFASSDDDHTEPSSATGNTGDNPAGYTRSDVESTSKFGRIIQKTRVSCSLFVL
jgi:hypothetical protein